MNKYLIEMLRLQTSVILPGFGSLMIGNTKTGKIVFNPLLKFNDGALAKYISQKEGIDAQAAQNQIAKFVREIEAEIGKGNSFDIFQLGKFTKNIKGEIEFIQDSNTNIAAETQSKPSVTKEPQQSKESVKTQTAETTKPVAEVKKEEKKTTESPVKKEEVIKDASLASKLTESETKKETEELISKQAKNSFNPDTENPKTETKPVEISKNIPVAEASKKDPAAQEKNKFTPVEEIKLAAEKSEPVITAKADSSVVEKKIQAVTDPVESKAGSEKSDDKKSEEKPSSLAGLSEKYKKGNDKTKKEPEKEKFKKDKPQKIKHENPENKVKKPKKKKRVVLWLILIIIVGGGTAAGWFYKDEINAFLHAGVGDHESDTTHTATSDTTKHETESHDEITPEDTTVVTETVEEPVDTEEIEEPQEEVKENPVVNHSSPGGTYHIIGNAFSSEKNADNYVNKMKEKGYSAQNIGKYNGLYLVSLKSFGSKEEAKNNLSSVKADAESAYVFTAK